MAKEEKKNYSNIILVIAAVLLIGIIGYAWNKESQPETTETKAECEVKVADGTAVDVNKLGPNEVQITAENFQTEVLDVKGVVLVDAYAPWCPHCQKIAPTISKIADDYVGKAKVGRMNANNQDPATKANFDYAVKSGLSGYPAIWIYKDGVRVEEFAGERDYCELRDALNKYL